MRILGTLCVLAACQSSASESASAAPAPAPAATAVPAAPAGTIEVRAGGNVVATLASAWPCRATIDGVAMTIDGPPLHARVGSAEWTTQVQANGTRIDLDGTPTARMFSPRPGELGIFDVQGVAMLRVRGDAAGSAVDVVDGSGRALRHGTMSGGGLQLPDGATVAGTSDVVLGALLASAELRPEIRALAACQRSLPKDTP